MKLEIETFNEDGDKIHEKTNDANGEDGSHKEPSGIKCEVQEHEARYDLKGQRIEKVIEGGNAEIDTKEGMEYAIRSYKYYNKEGALESSMVEILSPHIIKALQKVVKEYPSVNLGGDVIIIEGQVKCLFHYRKELAAYADDLEDQAARLHVLLALHFMERELRQPIKVYEAMVESATISPSTVFQCMWMIFRPGELVVTGTGEKTQVLQLVDTVLSPCQPPKWVVFGRMLTHDGTSFGHADRTWEVNGFEGSKPIRELQIFPLKNHENKEIIVDKLIARGKKFCSLKGSHHKFYKGIAFALGRERNRNQYGQIDAFPLETVMVEGRIIVDCKMFGVVKSPNRVILNETPGRLSQIEAVIRRMTGITKSSSVMNSEAPPTKLPNIGNDVESLNDEDFLICDYNVPGFSLSDKRWCLFPVEMIGEVEFNSDAFDTLLLPQTRKLLVKSLVENHGTMHNNFDDMIKGKGKGLVFVLHGEPGVGKTFTAECIADHARRPLYVMSSGELGVTPESVESNLNTALMLATTWKAIVLIDEADVFLEQRTAQDLTRNCLVSLFLRTLEYYQGIIFLTTNRITTFDLAFKSRVHLALKYPALDHASRKELWKLFIGRTANSDAHAWPDTALDELADVPVNGRQIKNAVLTANTLAMSSGTALVREHVGVVLESLKEFEEDLNGETQDLLVPAGKRPI